MGWAVRRLRHPGQGLLQPAVLLAMACATGAWAVDLAAHLQAGLAPSHHAWGATVAALLGWQGLHAFVLLLMGCYVVARSLAGVLRPDARATLDNTAPVALHHRARPRGHGLVRMLPQWMGG